MKYIQWVKSLFYKKEEVLKPSPKFGIGDAVSITTYSNQSKLWYKGYVIDIIQWNECSDFNRNSLHTMYKVHFLNGTGNGLTYWYLETELKKYSLEEERDSRIDEILKYDNS